MSKTIIWVVTCLAFAFVMFSTIPLTVYYKKQAAELEAYESLFEE